MAAAKETTGVLRADIELLRGDELMLFAPGADSYFKVSGKTVQIISFLTEDIPLENFLEKLSQNGISVTIDELSKILFFLRKKRTACTVFDPFRHRCIYLRQLCGCLQRADL